MEDVGENMISSVLITVYYGVYYHIVYSLQNKLDTNNIEAIILKANNLKLLVLVWLSKSHTSQI